MKEVNQYIPLADSWHGQADEDDDDIEETLHHKHPRRRGGSFHLVVGFPLLCLLLASFYFFLYAPETGDDPKSASTAPPACQRKVHLLLPATEASPRFCRTLASAILHGYDVSVINWGGSTHHSAKIFGTLDYIEKHTSAADLGLRKGNSTSSDDLDQVTEAEEPTASRRECQDIIVEIDAYDVLVQRPASYLIKTFEEQTNVSEVDAKGESGGASIVFSAEKGCHPPGEAWCDQVPDSPVAHHIFGPDTDRSIFEYNRPRWLNSGFVIGYANDMLKLYRAAADEATRRQGTFQADQSIFGPLFTSKAFNITLDYAGNMAALSFFFGLEMHFRPTKFTPRRPRLPALTFPAASEEGVKDEAQKQQQQQQRQQRLAEEAARKRVIDEHEARRGELIRRFGADAPEMRFLSPPFAEATAEAAHHPSRVRLFDDEEVPNVWHKHNIVHDTFPAFLHYNVPWKEHFDEDWQKTWWGGAAGLDIMEDVREHIEATGRLQRSDLMVPRRVAAIPSPSFDEASPNDEKHHTSPLSGSGSLAFTEVCQPGWHLIQP